MYFTMAEKIGFQKNGRGTSLGTVTAAQEAEQRRRQEEERRRQEEARRRQQGRGR